MSTTVREGYEVGDLDPAGVLEAAAEAEQTERRAAFRNSLAAHWADLHPATADTGVETPGGAALLADESLGGEGTPLVAAFTAEAFALALGMSPSAGAQLIADALDLRHRLPMLWKRLSRLEVPAWKARRVARQTHRLSKAAAIWVDEQLADRGLFCGPVVVDRLVAHAIAAYDPETHEDRENDARAGWTPTLTHPDPTDFLGASHLEATGDTLILRRSTTRSAASPTSCSSTATPHRWACGRSRPSASSPANPQRPGHPKVKAYVRVDATDLEVDGDGGSTLATGEVEKLGAATLTKIRTGSATTRSSSNPCSTWPDATRVDLHDPPAWMRDLVHLRDGHCVFPRCQVDARSCDLDHTIPYDENGPPGQTRPANLACLCRRHHRAKTTGRWRYLRTPDGDYHWHGPHGTTYVVRP